MASYAGYEKLTHRDQARDELQSERTKSKAVAPDIQFHPFSTNSKVESLESTDVYSIIQYRHVRCSTHTQPQL